MVSQESHDIKQTSKGENTQKKSVLWLEADWPKLAVISHLEQVVVEWKTQNKLIFVQGCDFTRGFD